MPYTPTLDSYLDRRDKNKMAIDMKLADVTAEIEQIRRERLEAKKEHEAHLKEISQHISSLKVSFIKKRKELKIRSIQEYAAELKDDTTPSSILILQSNLCRALHHLFVERSQLKLVTNITKDLAALTDKQVSKLEEEKSHLEIKVLNKMAEVQQQEEKYKKACLKTIQNQSIEITQIQNKLDSQRSDSNLDRLATKISKLNTQLSSRKLCSGDFEKQAAVDVGPKRSLQRRSSGRREGMQKFSSFRRSIRNLVY